MRPLTEMQQTVGGLIAEGRRRRTGGSVDPEHQLSIERVRGSRRTFLRTLASIAVVTSGTGLAGCGGEASERVVEMDDAMAFNPSSLTVTLGETVTWRNTGRAMTHTATTDPTLVRDAANVALPQGAMPWNSETIGPGQSWSHTFEVPGAYRYCCLPHELAGMVGAVTVEER